MKPFSHSFGRLVQAGLFLPAVIVTFVLSAPAFAEAPDIDSAICVSDSKEISALFSADVNRCPQAHAGYDTPIVLNQRIPLDASRTVDMDGQRLTFDWRLVKGPTGSGVDIEDASSLRTGFTPDLAGDYVFELMVTDSKGGTATDTVTFSTNNVPPVARAGANRTAHLGEMVALNASRSYDLDNDVLAYQWTMVEKPTDSTARLSNPKAASSSLVLDREGDYRIELKVNDQAGSGTGSELTLSTYNSAPVANAGRARVVGPNSDIVFDSSRSSDYDSDALSYHWSVLSAPQESKASFNNANVDNPTFTVGGDGLYLVQLMVDDGVNLSNPVTTLIEVKRDRLANFDLNDFLPLTNRNGGDDTDGDGILDPVDNCVLVANAPQRDTDGDGIGNFCDADLNNDGVINFIDITLWTPSFLGTDEDADFNGDGTVNFLDYIIITNAFLQQPGPPGTIVWVSLVDGNFNDRTNWEPQIVPSEGVTAIIDVPPAVTVTQSGGDIKVKNLVQNENLVLVNTTFEATGALELGGTMMSSSVTLNNTEVVPSLAGTGMMTLTNSTHSWTGNSLSVPVVLNNGTRLLNTDGLIINDTVTLNASSLTTGFTFLNDQTVSGNGTIFINGLGNGSIAEPRLLPANGVTLTLASGLTVRGGKGSIGQASANLVVNSTVAADVAGETLRISALDWSGTGTIRASNGGVMELSGNMNNSGATLNVDTAGGQFRLLNGGALRNAVINGAPGTNMTVNNGSTTFENLIFNGDINMLNGASTSVIGGLALNGNVLINASSLATGFVFLDSQTLGGNANIRIDGFGNGSITEPRLLPANGTTLTIAPTVNITGGKATIGQLTASLILEGNITADVEDETIQILGLNWSSNGTISAINNGRLAFGGNFDNGGNTLNLDTADGFINLLNGASLRNATIAGTAGTSMTINNGATSLEALNFTGDIVMNNGATSTVTEGLTLIGDLLIDAPSLATGLTFSGTQTFGGTGTVTLNGLGNGSITEPRLLPVGVDTFLTVDSGITIRGGKGSIGQNQSNLILLGDVIADVTGEEIRIGGLNWSSTGSIQSINGGIIGVFGGFDNAGNTLSVDTAGGEFQVLSGTTLANAIFEGTNGSVLRVNGGVTNMDGMTFNLDLNQLNGATTNVTNGLIINGTSTITAPTLATGYSFNGNQTLGGAATVVFDSATNGSITEPRLLPTGATGSTLTIASTVTIRGSKGTIGQIQRNVIMNGTINADVAGQSIRLLGANWSGTGNFIASNGGDIELNGTLNNANQTLNFDSSDGSITVLSGTQLRNAELDGTPATVFVFNSGTHTFENLTVNANMTMNNGAVANLFDGLTVNGTVTVNGSTQSTGFQFSNTQTLGGNATVFLNGIGNGSISETRLLPLGPAETVVTIGPNVLVRGGQATVGNVSRGLIVEGTISADFGRINVTGNSVINNGELEALVGNTLFIDNLSSSPGDLHVGPDSELLLADALTALTAGSDVKIDVGVGDTAGVITTVVGTSTLNGTLTMKPINGYAPSVGTMFTIMDVGNPVSGTFSTVDSQGLGVGESFSIDYTGDVTATVTN
ncbi:MAG: PKD domain-containing protein [Gammaproteobacteria bacterium]